MTVDTNALLCRGLLQVMTKPLRPLWVSQSSRIWLDQVGQEAGNFAVLHCIAQQLEHLPCFAACQRLKHEVHH